MRRWTIVAALCVLGLSLPAIASALPVEKDALEQSIVVDEYAASDGGGPGPTMPDFPQYPWIGDRCYTPGKTGCWYSPSHPGSVACRCYYDWDLDGYYWDFD